MTIQAQTAIGSNAFSFTMSDARADRGERGVTLQRERIIITRRLRGMAMRLNVPASTYRGVALSLQPTRSGGSFYQVTLVHPDRELSIVLQEALDDRTVLADWNRWSRFFDKARLVEREPGLFEDMDRRVGGVGQGETVEPRRTRVTRERRGRFLARRKPGDAARSQAVFSLEREIICYE